MEFQSKVACEVGVNGAIMLQNIYFWVKRNEANDKNFYDGRYWTYNSKKAFTVLFPFWTERQIKTILDKLREDEYLEVGNYNATPYDRTLWYTLTDKGWALFEDTFHWTKMSNETDQKDQPIPDNKPDIKTNNNKHKEIIDHLNKTAGKNFKVADSHGRLINARYREGYTLEDFKAVIDFKTSKWKGTDMEQYLRPSTLFGNKFQNYVNEIPNRSIESNKTVEEGEDFKNLMDIFKGGSGDE